MKLNISREVKRKLSHESKMRKKRKKLGAHIGTVSKSTLVRYDLCPLFLPKLSAEKQRVLMPPYIHSFPLKEPLPRQRIDLTLEVKNDVVTFDKNQTIAKVFLNSKDRRPVEVELWN